MAQPPDDANPALLTELISRAQRGEEEAFRQLWNRSLYDSDLRLNAYLVHLKSEREEREDLAQEICLKVWLSLPELRNPAGYRSWLFKIALRTAIDSHRRRHSRIQPVPEAEGDALQGHAGPDFSVEEMELTKRALETLPWPRRACLILAALGCSTDEIAEITGIDPRSAATYVSTARAKARKAYYELQQGLQSLSQQDPQPPSPSKAKHSSQYFEERIQKQFGTKLGSFLASRFKELFGKGVEFNGR